jgi:ABC-2 type transport system permease protein
VKKIFAVLKREYLAAVRKKMFVFMTLFFPVLMSGLMFIPIMMMTRALGDKNIAVVDATGRLASALSKPLTPEVPNARDAVRGRRRDLPQALRLEYVDAHGQNAQEAAKPYLSRLMAGKQRSDALDAVFVVPANVFDDPNAKFTFYSRSATDIMTQERLAAAANHAMQRQRLLDRGITGAQLDAITASNDVEGVQLSRSGEQKKGGELNFILAFVLAALLIVPAFMYGVEIMRGIVQEKSDRVMEVLISSMSPFELLTGKISGVALVGLTQIGVWLLILGGGAAIGATAASMAGINVMQFLRPTLFIYFIVFFVLGYLTYVCVYAVAGAACNTDKEAQQMMMPIQLVMMMPWFVMMPIITNPESKMAVMFSLMPVFGPVTMFARTVASEPPVWHIALSIGVSIVTIFVFFWATAKIFRVGVLSYGKRPTIPELWRWMKVA